MTKTEDNPMKTREPSRLRRAPRCLARTRRGTPCQSPAVAGKTRCRMHGGAAGSGAPKGKRNGKYRHGGFTTEAIDERRRLASLIRDSRVFRLAQKTPKEGKGHLDDNEISSSGARCVDVTGLRAREPGVAKIRLQRQSRPQQARHSIHWMPRDISRTDAFAYWRASGNEVFVAERRRMDRRHLLLARQQSRWRQPRCELRLYCRGKRQSTRGGTGDVRTFAGASAWAWLHRHAVQFCNFQQ